LQNHRHQLRGQLVGTALDHASGQFRLGQHGQRQRRGQQAALGQAGGQRIGAFPKTVVITDPGDTLQ
jgi:hypothetical protein